MEPITQPEYWNEVSDLAQSILSETVADNPDTEPDAMREQVSERLWETIDGHQWIIYTYYAQQVCVISPNDGYSAENFGPESVVDENGIKWEAVAFGALYADVCEAIWPLFDSWETELDDASELEGKTA